MKIQILALLAIIAIASAHLTWHSIKSTTPHLYSFTDYEVEFNKKYTDEREHEIRKAKFQENMEKILKVNSDPNSTWKAGVNDFTDRFPHELDNNGFNRPLAFQRQNMMSPNFVSRSFLKDLPASVDWREKGVVSPVRNQGKCGSCWAFSTIAVTESHVAIASGKLTALSEQQLVDCVPNPKHCGGSGGCEGLVEPIAYTYGATNGFVARESYAYTAQDGFCRDVPLTKVASIAGVVELPTNNPQKLMEAVATQGPVSISVAASDFKNYESGIYSGDCGYVTNHAVVLIGYGADDKGNLYWIVRNSWGEKWGEQGHIRLPREPDFSKVNCDYDLSPADGAGCDGGPDKVNVCGKCGMYFGSSYPTGAKLN